MNASLTAVAKRLLAAANSAIEEVRIFEFVDDETAHDDELQERMEAEFSTAFTSVQDELSKEFGDPVSTGEEENNLIPLNGVFRFAIWNINGRSLFAAAAHEDRELPFLLMLGTAEDDGEF